MSVQQVFRFGFIYLQNRLSATLIIVRHIVLAHNTTTTTTNNNNNNNNTLCYQKTEKFLGVN